MPWFSHRDSRAAEGSGPYSENMRTCPPSGASRAAYRPCFSRAAKTGRSPAAAAPCMPAGRKPGADFRLITDPASNQHMTVIRQAGQSGVNRDTMALVDKFLDRLF